MISNNEEERPEEIDAGSDEKPAKRRIRILKRALFILLIVILAAAAAAAMVIRHYTAVSVYENEDEFERFASERFSKMHVLPDTKERLITVDYEDGQSVAFRFDPLLNEQLAIFRDQRVDELRKEFEKEAQESESLRTEKGEDEKMFYRKMQHSLLIDTAVYDAGNGALTLAIYSVRFNEENDRMEEGQPRISTYLLDAGDLHVLEPFQALQVDYRGQISSYIWSNLNSLFRTSDLQEKYEPYLEDNESNFNEFVISQGGITLFFDPGTVEKPDAGVSTVTIPASYFAPSIRDELTDRIIDPAKPMVAITYDDGPGLDNEAKILRTLKKHGVVATFFYLGNRVGADPKNVKMAYDMGCEIANHSWDHSDMTDLSEKAIKKQIKKTNKAIKKVTGDEPALFRPPYGSLNESVVDAVEMPVILWTVDTLDWKSRDADKVFKKIKKTKKLDGKIILMHSLYEETADETEKLIPWLKKHGYQIVTVSELIQYKRGEAPKSGKVYLSGTK